MELIVGEQGFMLDGRTHRWPEIDRFVLNEDGNLVKVYSYGELFSAFIFRNIWEARTTHSILVDNLRLYHARNLRGMTGWIVRKIPGWTVDGIRHWVYIESSDQKFSCKIRLVNVTAKLRDPESSIHSSLIFDIHNGDGDVLSLTFPSSDQAKLFEAIFRLETS